MMVYAKAGMLVQDQSLVPRTSATSITARDGPRHPPATEQQLQQAQSDASEQAQPTTLDLFRSCSDVEAAVVDLEGTSRRGWTMML
jgi:hypothetical protein